MIPTSHSFSFWIFICLVLVIPNPVGKNIPSYKPQLLLQPDARIVGTIDIAERDPPSFQGFIYDMAFHIRSKPFVPELRKDHEEPHRLFAMETTEPHDGIIIFDTEEIFMLDIISDRLLTGVIMGKDQIHFREIHQPEIIRTLIKRSSMIGVRIAWFPEFISKIQIMGTHKLGVYAVEPLMPHGLI